MTEDIGDRFRELGASERQVGLIVDGRECVRDVFLAVDERGEARKAEVVRSVEWATSTVEQALRELRRGYGVVDKRPDPIDGRQVVFYVDEPGDADTGGVDAAPPCRRCPRQAVRDGLCTGCLEAVEAGGRA